MFSGGFNSYINNETPTFGAPLMHQRQVFRYTASGLLDHFGHGRAAAVGGAGVVGAAGGNQGEHHDGEEG